MSHCRRGRSTRSGNERDYWTLHSPPGRRDLQRQGWDTERQREKKNAGEGCAGIMTSGLNSPPESQLEPTGEAKCRRWSSSRSNGIKGSVDSDSEGTEKDCRRAAGKRRETGQGGSETGSFMANGVGSTVKPPSRRKSSDKWRMDMTEKWLASFCLLHTDCKETISAFQIAYFCTEVFYVHKCMCWYREVCESVEHRTLYTLNKHSGGIKFLSFRNGGKFLHWVPLWKYTVVRYPPSVMSLASVRIWQH